MRDFKLGSVDTTGMAITGFTKSTNDIRVALLHTLGATGYVLYISLLSHRNMATGECYPSTQLLSKELNVSRRTIQTQLSKLHEAGFIIINSGKQGVCSNYFFPYEDFYTGEGGIATKRTNKFSQEGGKDESLLVQATINRIKGVYIKDKELLNPIISDFVNNNNLNKVSDCTDLSALSRLLVQVKHIVGVVDEEENMF